MEYFSTGEWLGVVTFDHVRVILRPTATPLTFCGAAAFAGTMPVVDADHAPVNVALVALTRIS
jgi:uncharacterized membrane protein YadS